MDRHQCPRVASKTWGQCMPMMVSLELATNSFRLLQSQSPNFPTLSPALMFLHFVCNHWQIVSEPWFFFYALFVLLVACIYIWITFGHAGSADYKIWVHVSLISSYGSRRDAVVVQSLKTCEDWSEVGLFHSPFCLDYW